MYIMGINGHFYRGNQDSAAAIAQDNVILAAAEEERFTRIKHSRAEMPIEAMRYCLKAAGLDSLAAVDMLAFPQLTWENLDEILRDFLKFHFGALPKEIVFLDHHRCHAASTYYISGFEEAMILTADWSGDGATTTLSIGKGDEMPEISRFKGLTGSLGAFYGMMTQYLGFRRDADEYKVMGLASYGKPTQNLSFLLSVEAGGYTLHEDYLHQGQLAPYPHDYGKTQPVFSALLEEKLGKARLTHEPITQYHKDLAASAQRQLELVALELVKTLRQHTTSKKLCLAGGTALNCKMNGMLLQTDLVDEVYVPPVASDAGLALGAVLLVGKQCGFSYSLPQASLGPAYSADDTRYVLERSGIAYHESPDILDFTAEQLAEGKIIGWFQGGMEYGPRALGNRSILADPRRQDMRDTINHRVKFREDFRPFAPSALREHAAEFYEYLQDSPFMTVTFPVKPDQAERIPATTHVDVTARVQTVAAENNALYYDLIQRFYQKTGIPMVLNTSFNTSWEPIVMSPVHALGTFFATGLDYLVIDNFVVEKK